MENIFSKAKTRTELEDMYLKALKGKRYGEERIENDYQKRQAELLGTINIPQPFEYVETEKKASRKTNKIPEEMNIIWIRGNVSFPYLNLILQNGKYNFVAKDKVKYNIIKSGMRFSDYIPHIENNELYIPISNKMSSITDIEQDMEIRIEEGEEAQLVEGYFSETYVTERVENGNVISAVETLLLSPSTSHIKWKIMSFFAYHNGTLEQIPFSINYEEKT